MELTKREDNLIKRQSNIELLRIVAMIMIIAHHIAVHSGFGFSTEFITLNRLWIQFIQIGGKIGVNIFVLISGYFLVTAKSIKPNKVANLWLQVFSYSVVIFAVFVLFFDKSFGKELILKNFLPITFAKWWFASTYFVLYLLSPYINRFVNSIDKKTYIKFLFLMMVCWCVVPTLFNQNFQSNNLLWFIFLYCVAGYIRLHLDAKKFKKGWCIFLAVLITVMTYFVTVVYDILGTKIQFFASRTTYFYEMGRLPILLIAVFLFVGFLNLNICYKSVINVVSSATFGVYLIHDNNYIREFLWITLFKNQDYKDSSLLIPYTIMQIIIVFVVCTVIELFRINCVEKLYSGLVDKIIVFAGGFSKRVLSLKIFDEIKKYI